MSRRRGALIALQGLKIERPLVAKGIVEALAADPHRRKQILSRGRSEALRPEHSCGALQSQLAIKLSRPRHGHQISEYGPISQQPARPRGPETDCHLTKVQSEWRSYPRAPSRR